MEISKIKLIDIEPADYNPRTITEEAKKKLRNSIETFGLVEPIIINTKNNRIVSGHQRYQILIDMLMEEDNLAEREFDYLVKDDYGYIFDFQQLQIKNEDYEKALNIVLNNTNLMGDYDYEKLSALLEELEFNGFDLTFTGFDNLDDVDIDLLGDEFSFMDNETEFTETVEDDYDFPTEEELEVKVQYGELYQLGNHRLLCGDSTVEANVKKLMGGAEIDLLFTDPPYGVDVVKGNTIRGDGPLGSIGGPGIVKAKKYKPVLNDDKPFDPTFLLNYDCNKIIWGANNFSSKLPDNAKWLVWLKEPLNEDGMFEKLGHTFGNVELAWTNLKGIGCMCYHHLWRGLLRGGDRKTELSERVSPTQKPVKLLADILNDYSEETDVVLDLFGGSGSTLIACEQLNRQCYMMELDPYYCQVIINRWEEYTGRKAELIEGANE